MGLPKKGIKESDLRYVTLGKALNDGSHEIYKVQISENDKVLQGFYKKLAPANHYPEFLAKISVGIAVIKQSFQGAHSAEERLVFNDKGQIVGTFSMELKGFRSYKFTKEDPPSDAAEKAQLIPKLKTLIQSNAMENLVVRWMLRDDDLHPHNWGPLDNGLVGDIDFDMLLYWFTYIMKEGRIGIPNPCHKVNLTVRDWQVFPNIKDAKPYHFPAYNYPGQESLPLNLPAAQTVLPKAYPEPQSFQQLSGSKDAQEQKVAAALKILLAYQPAMLRARLLDYFGSISLNYTALDISQAGQRQRRAYEEHFSHLCNAQTNTQPFVDFMLSIYKEHYDNLYKVVVYYMGCENNGTNLALPAMHASLHDNPNLYREIKQWMKRQNVPLETGSFNPCQYDLILLQKRYHQIWRDAFAPVIKQILREALNLIQNISLLANYEIVSEFYERAVGDLTDSQPFVDIGALTKEDISASISLNKDRDRVLFLLDFTSNLSRTIEKYYNKKVAELEIKDNSDFVQTIEQLLKEFEEKAEQFSRDLAKDFNTIYNALKRFTRMANFQLHLVTPNIRLSELSAAPALNPNDIQVKEHYNQVLFSWVRSMKPQDFNRMLCDIIDNHYANFFQANTTRKRAKDVKEYLDKNLERANDERLAYIFTSGSNEAGALNKALIKHLTLQCPALQHVPSVCDALSSGTFFTEIAAFAVAACEYARANYSQCGASVEQKIELFYEAFFNGVQNLSHSQFVGLANSALAEYEQTLWGRFNSPRKEVATINANSPKPDDALVNILKSNNHLCVYNKYLFDKIITHIKQVLATPRPQKSGLLNLPGYKLIAQYQNTQDSIYFNQLKEQASRYAQVTELIEEDYLVCE